MAWRVARSLDVLLGQLNARFPHRSKLSDGSIGDAAHASRSSDHNPWYGPGIVTARDYTHDPKGGVDINRLSDELAASRDPRIKYVIANGMILDSRPGNRPWQWVRYTGSNQHTKHLHLSVMDNPSCDDTRPWNLPMLGGAAPAPTPSEVPDVELNTTFTTAWNKPLSYGDYLKFSDQRLVNIEAAVLGMANEMYGPRGPKGEIKGWGTVNGPRTVVAMLVDLVNAAYAPIPSAVDGSDVKFNPRQALANVDAYGYSTGQKLNGLLAAFNELADAYASERGTDAQTIKDAVREALEEGTVKVDVSVSGAVPDNSVSAERDRMEADR